MYKIIHALVFVVLSSSVAFSQCPQLIWEDQFDKPAIDTTKWSFQNGNGCPDLCGWGNNELQYYRPENTKIENGKLIITVKKEDYNGAEYTSSKIRSIYKGDWTYGRFEARIKFPAGSGMWPAFWMMPTDNSYGGWPRSGEIDIAEVAGKDPEQTFGTIHYGQPMPNNKSSGATYRKPGVDLSSDFHTYAVEWEPGKIKWFMDNVLFNTITSADIAPEAWPFDKRFYLMFNIAVGGWFGGLPDVNTTFPQTMEIEYVKVFSNPNTPALSGNEITSVNETETYSVTVDGSVSYAWSVPADAMITSGEGTNKITVKWGFTSGKVNVDITDPTCNKSSNYLNVKVLTDTCTIILEDFENNRNMAYSSGTGQYNYNITNPNTSSINTSAKVGTYKRNASQQWDYFIYKNTLIKNATEIENGNKALYIDVYSNAPAGTKIYAQLESSALTPKAYPSGRRSSLLATTTAQGKWQTLKFSFSNMIDGGTPPDKIDRISFLFDGGNYTSTLFYFDNIILKKINNSNCLLSFLKSNQIENSRLSIYPNPVKNTINVEADLIYPTDITLKIVNLLGQELITKKFSGRFSFFNETIDIAALDAGIYTLKVFMGNRVETVKLIKE